MKCERDAVSKELASFLHQQKVPGKRDCDRCLMKCGTALEGRSWKDIKNYVRNVNRRAKRLVTKLLS